MSRTRSTLPAAARPSPTTPPQGPQAGGEHPVLHRAPGLPEAHRLLTALPLRRGPPGPREEEERQEGPGRGWSRRRRGGGLSPGSALGRRSGRVPQIIKQDMHSVELVFTAVSLPRSDTHPSGAAMGAATFHSVLVSFVPVRGAVARWWSLFPLGLALPYPDRHICTSLHHTSRGPTVQAKTKLEGASRAGPALRSQ